MQSAARLFPLPALAPAAEAVRSTPFWLAVDFPLLAVEALSIQAEDRAVVVEPARRGAVVYQASGGARSMGITPGLGINAAMTICTGLDVYLRDADAEHRLLHIFERWAGRFTPMVCLDPPTTVLLEVAASLKLFGGLDNLCAQLRRGLDRLNHHYCLAVASTPAAGSILARAGWEVEVTHKAALRSSLGGLPLESLGLTADTQQKIKAIGIETLRELWRLPRHDAARRFGPEVVRKIDCLLGACPDPRTPDVPPLDFSCRHDLEEATGDTDLLTPIVRSLLAHLMEFLKRADATAKEIHVALHHHETPASRFTIRTRLPTRSSEQWIRLWSEHMHGRRLPAAVGSVDLHIERLLPNDAATPDLFHGGDPAREWARSLDELEARLGKDRMWKPKLAADHRPEYAWHRLNHDHAGWGLNCAQRPLWLFSEPRQLRCRADRVWHTGPLHIIEGPERIESGWWDDREYCRDYYTATSAQDGRLWIFQDLKQKNRWYLHGLFG